MCRTINTLILDGNCLDDKCAAPLADLLASHQYLLHVSLSKNLFEDISAARSFSAALSRNQSIEHFDISFNHFQQKATAVFIEFLSENFRLRSLNLAYSSFGLCASKAFSLAMQTKNTQLKELDLSSNLIDDECAKYLASVLSINESLEKLYLMRNPLSVNGCYTLLKPLQTMPTSNLEIIDIRDMSIKSQAFQNLVDDLEARFYKLCIRRGEKLTV
jgi:Ran GTPase-activating protein (RanGAP) involved in mRNA processing and transport